MDFCRIKIQTKNSIIFGNIQTINEPEEITLSNVKFLLGNIEKNINTLTITRSDIKSLEIIKISNNFNQTDLYTQIFETNDLNR